MARHLGLYMTRPERREESERIRLERGRLEMWFLEPLEKTRRKARLCSGFRWLLTGRLQASTGARGLFTALKDVTHLTLVFYDVETRVEPDREGAYRQHRRPKPLAQFTISREKAAKLVGVPQLRRALRGPQCLRRGQQLVDIFWTPEAS